MGKNRRSQQSAPKWLETRPLANTNKSNDEDNAVFVDLTEAAVSQQTEPKVLPVQVGGYITQ